MAKTKTRKATNPTPFRTGFLSVSQGHRIYYEEFGRDGGTPGTMLHGGPGGGLNRKFATLFDLSKWHLVLFDQRGCGKSTPFCTDSLAHNTTWDLVADIEQLRTHLGFETWFVSGGSWGTTLALAYAEAHPRRVSGILLRGVCVLEPYEFEWLYEQGGASEVFPDTWTEFLKPLPPSTRTKGYREIMKTYRRLLADPKTRQAAVKGWWEWESSVSFLIPVPDDTPPKQATSLALIENHYFLHNGWLKPQQLIKNAYRLKGIPMTIIHGRYDMVCPVRTAWRLHEALPESKLVIVPNAGHGMREPKTLAMIKKSLAAFTKHSN